MTQQKIAKILDLPTKRYNASWWFDLIIASLIILNFSLFILETVESFRAKYKSILDIIEVCSLSIFTLEYIMRIYAAPKSIEFKNKKNPRIHFIKSFYGIIDLVAILPGLLLRFFGIYFPSNAIRILRLLKVFRLFKLSRYFAAIKIMGKVLQKKKEQMIIAITMLMLLLMLSSIVMYYVENSKNAENFSSIPATMWWAVATLTTVGYGDISPITPLGKFLGGVIAIMGVGLFALPAGILASGFSSEIEDINIDELGNENKKVSNENLPKPIENLKCPHCENEIRFILNK